MVVAAAADSMSGTADLTYLSKECCFWVFHKSVKSWIHLIPSASVLSRRESDNAQVPTYNSGKRRQRIYHSLHRQLMMKQNIWLGSQKKTWNLLFKSAWCQMMMALSVQALKNTKVSKSLGPNPSNICVSNYLQNRTNDHACLYFRQDFYKLANFIIPGLGIFVHCNNLTPSNDWNHSPLLVRVCIDFFIGVSSDSPPIFVSDTDTVLLQWGLDK